MLEPDFNDNCFAAACYNMNSLSELREALTEEPDMADCKAWRITGAEWYAQIRLAIAALEQELEVDK